MSPYLSCSVVELSQPLWSSAQESAVVATGPGWAGFKSRYTILLSSCCSTEEVILLHPKPQVDAVDPVSHKTDLQPYLSCHLPRLDVLIE